MTGGQIFFSEVKDTSMTAKSGGAGISCAVSAQIFVLSSGYHARVFSELPGKLAVADIDCINSAGAPLQEAVGKAAGGSTHIHHDFTGNVNAEGVEGFFKLGAAAAYIAVGTAFKADLSGERDQCSGLVNGVIIDHNLSGHDERAGLG